MEIEKKYVMEALENHFLPQKWNFHKKNGIQIFEVLVINIQLVM